ncbi:hypothetical protein SKAU_G00236730 [Synaphobranchus kaupii]|uniref:DNA topoisomerase n=1 Tax=Synaphobranchus kaupii TaxID=118154 RepID=A0A9Q1ITG9_SYNKA|nr:hypothetical protein SKAU_G00236730 [Synaphobranchus kaupii]
MLNASSKLKGEKDWEKYEVARRLNSCVDQIQSQYCQDMNFKEMLTRHRATALYFKLALRVGNEKEADEMADTVGCCSLRVEHITLHRPLDGNKYVVEFDFLGKDSIRYYNKVPVTKRASGDIGLNIDIDSKTKELSQARTELKMAKWKAKGHPDSKWHIEVEKKRKATRHLEDQLQNLIIQAIGWEEGKQITSKLNYLDPHISIAWCMKINVSLDKIYNKSQREKIAWAIDMTEANFEF